MSAGRPNRPLLPAPCWAAALACLPLLAAPPALAEESCTVLYGATVHLPDGPVEGASVVLDGGRIAAAGTQIDGLELGEETAQFRGQACALLDHRGRQITAGLVEARTALGLVEVGMEDRTRDTTWARNHPVHAAMQVADAYNPQSSLIAIARAAGITTAVLAPSGGSVAGQGAAVDLAGMRQSEALVKSPVALYATIRVEGSRSAALASLRSLFADARLYARAGSAFDRNQTRALGASAADLEALQPVLNRQVPLVIGADRAADIEALLRFAADQGIQLVIGGGAEAWMLRDLLAAAQVPVIVDPLVYGPGSFDQLHGRAENPALLHEAGVPLIISSGSSHFARILRFLAGNAVRGGLAHEAALKAITETPAKVFGLNDRGVIRGGAAANLVVWSGDPLEISTAVTAVYIGGVARSLENRQTRLRDKYRTLPATPSAPLPLP